MRREHDELIVEYNWNGSSFEPYTICGILIRCRNCMFYDPETSRCGRFLCGVYVHRNHFCGWGIKSKEDENGKTDQDE